MNLPTGQSLGEKIKTLRNIEGDLSQKKLGDLVGISQGTIASIEAGKSKTLGVDALSKIIKHPRFYPYTMWLIDDDLTEEQAADTVRFLSDLKGRSE